MKKTIVSFIFVMAYMCAQAQIVKVYENGVLTYTATSSRDNEVTVSIEEENIAKVDPNLNPGKFTVSQKKKVMFTKSNIYWDGSAFKFEKNPTDYQSSWDANHVSQFYWTKTAEKSYAEDYDDGVCTASDVPFFAESKGGMTVEGTTDLFVLTNKEFNYILRSRPNASELMKSKVTVGTTEDCLILAPDDFTGTLKDIYTIEEINSLGLVCLASCGERIGKNIKIGDYSDTYWTSTPDGSDEAYEFVPDYINVSFLCKRSYALPVRLVTLSWD